jgi:hypothetical protein
MPGQQTNEIFCTRTALATKHRALRPSASPAQFARLFGWTKAQATAALAL